MTEFEVSPVFIHWWQRLYHAHFSRERIQLTQLSIKQAIWFGFVGGSPRPPERDTDTKLDRLVLSVHAIASITVEQRWLHNVIVIHHDRGKVVVRLYERRDTPVCRDRLSLLYPSIYSERGFDGVLGRMKM